MAEAEALRVGFRQHRRQCFQLPTGGGKTVIAGYICQEIRKKNLTTLILVHRRELVSQWVNTLQRAGLLQDVGIIHPSCAPTPWAPIQIVSVASWRRLQAMGFDPHMVIVDEGHHIRAATWERIRLFYPKAYLLLLTATPARLDGKGLRPHCDYLHCGPTVPELIEFKRLCPVRTVHVDVGFRRTGIKKIAGDLSKKALIAQLQGSSIIAATRSSYERYAAGCKAIFFGVSIEHSKETAEDFRAHGISSEHIDGTTPDKHRVHALRRFEEGEIGVLCNVDLVSEGFDAPRCDCIIDSQATESVTKYLQRLGRTARYQKGKLGLHMDLCGNVRHGFIDTPREWTLDGVDETPKKQKARIDAMLCCPECATVYPSKQSACPTCGKARSSGKPIIEVDVDLKETFGDPEVKRRPRRAEHHGSNGSCSERSRPAGRI